MERVEEKRPNFLDLTGKFIPEKKGLFARLSHFLRNYSRERDFWTPERVQLAEIIIADVNQELEPFGTPKIEFHKNQVKLLEREAMLFDAEHDPVRGYIHLPLGHQISNAKFTADYAHEILHHASLRLVHGSTLRRNGLKMADANKQTLFTLINESVIEKTTALILKKHFLPSNPDQVESVIIVDDLCRSISATYPQRYSSPEDVFLLFQRATFGRGQAKLGTVELGRLIEKTYGRGNFRKLGELLEGVPKKVVVEQGKPRIFWDFTSPEYQALERFLRQPWVEAEFRKACQIPKEIDPPELYVFNFSLVPDGIPFVDFRDYDGQNRKGLLGRLKNFLGSFENDLKIQNRTPIYSSLAIRSGGKTYRDLAREALEEGFLRFPFIWTTIFDYERVWSGPGASAPLRRLERATLISDSQIDEQVKNLLFDFLGKEEQPLVVLKEDNLEMQFYRTNNPLSAFCEIYCLVARKPESDLVAYALSLAPKGIDPQIWWQKN